MNPQLLQRTLRRLVPHVEVARIALTGGVAIGLHSHAPDDDPGRGLVADDVDFVARDVQAVHPTAADEFLVSHYHLPQPGLPKFLVQLVDPETRLRLDFFPDTLGALNGAPVIQVAGIPMRVLRAGDILDHKLALLSQASEASPVDEKHARDAKRLALLCRREVPPVASAHLARDVYSQDVDAPCLRCQASRGSGFPLAPRQAIFEILGYV